MSNPENPNEEGRDFVAPDDSVADQRSVEPKTSELPEWLSEAAKETFAKVLNAAMQSRQSEIHLSGLDIAKRNSEGITDDQVLIELGIEPVKQSEKMKSKEKYDREITAEAQRLTWEIRDEIERNGEFNATLHPEDFNDLVATMNALEPVIHRRVKDALEHSRSL